MLPRPCPPGDAGRAAAAAPARTAPVLGARRDPLQLNLFLRHGALDVK
ncbi:MAG TPA: hypothetical protein VFX50_15260 [Gemmatimonadales bacterium]|nr:hypothetical protein [Gemmatimonadales bacterium]